MSEQAYRRFMERYQRRMADRQPPTHDAWMNEPVLGRAQEAGLLGLPLPRTEPDLADIVLDLLASADEPPLGGEALTGPNAAEQARTDASAQAILNGETPDPTGGAEYFYKGTPDQPPRADSLAPA